MISANEALSLYINTLPKIKEALEKQLIQVLKKQLPMVKEIAA